MSNEATRREPAAHARRPLSVDERGLAGFLVEFDPDDADVDHDALYGQLVAGRRSMPSMSGPVTSVADPLITW